MDHKEREPVKIEEKPQEKSLTKISLIVVGAVAVIMLGVVAYVLVSRMPAAKADKHDEAAAVNEIDTISTVELGRIEVSKANDPMQQSYTRVSVKVFLVVPSDKTVKMAEMIGRLGPILQESSRQAFLDADSRDLASENTAGIKNAIKTRINQKLGEELVKEVVFSEYRAY